MLEIITLVIGILKTLPITIKSVAIILAGIVGSVIAGFKKKMNRIQFFQSLTTGVFVSWLIGAFLGGYLNLPPEVVYAFCALGGHFSDEILKQLSIIVKSLAMYINMVIDKWLK